MNYFITLRVKNIFLKKIFQITVLLILTLNTKSWSQQKISIKAQLVPEKNSLLIHQKIVYKNNLAQPIHKLILNDWNHSYTNRKTKLGHRFSDQFIRNFHLSTAKERGHTTIEKFTINQFYANWCRIDDQVDVIELQTPTLQKGDSITIAIDYELKIPDAKFTRWGVNKGNFYLKDCFLVIAKNQHGVNLQYSNENIDDATIEEVASSEFLFDVPQNYTITSNLSSSNPTHFLGQNQKEFQFAIEKNATFETYFTDKMTVETNLNGSRITEVQKALIIDKVVTYFEEKLGPAKEKKVIVSQNDYDRNPFYGLNQLPAFISPFPNSFLYELKFLKTYSQNYLKQNLNINFREDHYLLSGIQNYLLINYIEENYPDLKLVGSLGNFKITRGYQLAKAKFNDQYFLAYLLMGRKNLDQPLTESKENLVKFNEQIATKYKAGLAFKFLSKYLNNDQLDHSIRLFLEKNKTEFTTAGDFETILKANTSENMDWFFKEMINSNQDIDYAFGQKKEGKQYTQVIIKNKSESAVPLMVTGYNKKKKVFEKWIKPLQFKDTAITVSRDSIDRIAINRDNYFTEINNRNNFKSLKGFLHFNKPFKFAFIRDIENAKYNQVFYYPEIGYNVYDGAIITLSLNNRSLIERPFTYNLSPSYSTTTQSITGATYFNYVVNTPHKKFFQTRLSFSSAYFHYIENASYLRITPSVLFRFRENQIKENKSKSLLLRQVIVNKEYSPLAINDNSPLNYSVFDARYAVGNNETAHGYGALTNLQFGDKFGKLVTEVTFRKLFESNYQIGLRYYGGLFLYNNTNTDYFSFGLDRPKDYLFDYQFYGRSESAGFFSQQIIIAEGGFKSKFTNPYANHWMNTLNITSSVWKWIQLYGDVGAYKNKGQKPIFVYDSGIHFNLVPDYFEIFCPIYSKNGWEIADKNYVEKIRFQFTLNPKILIGIFTRKWF